MCKVNSFLGFIRLEKYAIATGWYSLIRTTFFIVFVIVVNCFSELTNIDFLNIDLKR